MTKYHMIALVLTWACLTGAVVRFVIMRKR